jgi:hypothetical protein
LLFILSCSSILIFMRSIYLYFRNKKYLKHKL